MKISGFSAIFRQVLTNNDGPTDTFEDVIKANNATAFCVLAMEVVVVVAVVVAFALIRLSLGVILCL